MATWTCGIKTLPGHIQGDPPIPLIGVIWLCDGLIVHISPLEGTSVDDLQLRKSFDKAVTESAAEGPRKKPKRIRVADRALARRLKKVLPRVYVDVRPTPEIDEVVESMAQQLEARSAPIDEFMELGEVVRDALMPAALQLFDLRPWAVFPPDTPVRVVIPSQDLADGRLSVMGHNGEVFGFMLFRSAGDHARFESEVPTTNPVALPICYSLNYEPIPTSTLSGDPKDTGDFPLPLLTVFEGGAQRVPSQREAKLLIATALGLSRFMKRRATELMSQSRQAQGIKGEYLVEALGEKIDVRVSFKL